MNVSIELALIRSRTNQERSCITGSFHYRLESYRIISPSRNTDRLAITPRQELVKLRDDDRSDAIKSTRRRSRRGENRDFDSSMRFRIYGPL